MLVSLMKQRVSMFRAALLARYTSSCRPPRRPGQAPMRDVMIANVPAASEDRRRSANISGYRRSIRRRESPRATQPHAPAASILSLTPVTMKMTSKRGKLCAQCLHGLRVVDVDELGTDMAVGSAAAAASLAARCAALGRNDSPAVRGERSCQAQPRPREAPTRRILRSAVGATGLFAVAEAIALTRCVRHSNSPEKDPVTFARAPGSADQRAPHAEYRPLGWKSHARPVAMLRGSRAVRRFLGCG